MQSLLTFHRIFLAKCGAHLILALLMVAPLAACEKRTAQTGTRTICSSCSKVISEDVRVVAVGFLTNPGKVKVREIRTLCPICSAREAAANSARKKQEEVERAKREAKELAYQNELIAVRHVSLCEQCRKAYSSSTEMMRRKDAKGKSEIITVSGFCSRGCEVQLSMNRRLRKTGEVVGEAGKNLAEGLKDGSR